MDNVVMARQPVLHSKLPLRKPTRAIHGCETRRQIEQPRTGHSQRRQWANFGHPVASAWGGLEANGHEIIVFGHRSPVKAESFEQAQVRL